MWYVHTMKFYSEIKKRRKKHSCYTTMQVNLTHTMLSKGADGGGRTA